jgi:histidine triad (HIT) family protein
VIEESGGFCVKCCLEISFSEVGQRGFDMAELSAVVGEGNDSALGAHDNDPTVRDFGSICKEKVFNQSGTILLGMATLFSKIINREIPAEIVFENEYVVAFRDIQPQAPVHILIVPRAEISGLAELPDSGDHQHLLNAAKVIAEQEGLGGGYRVVINQGADAGQTVFHLHAHLLGGAPLGGFGVPGLDH